MPRVHHVRKARKDNPVAKAGQSYYWWKFMHQSRCYSATRPRHSQLCQGKNASFYAALEGLEDEAAGATENDDLDTARTNLVESLGEVRDDYQDGWDNLPENFQYADTGETMQEAIYSIEELISELECWEPEEFEEEDFDEDEPDATVYDDDEEYDDDLGIWEDARNDHEAQQERAADEHLQDQRDALIETSSNHCFPY